MVGGNEIRYSIEISIKKVAHLNVGTVQGLRCLSCMCLPFPRMTSEYKTRKRPSASLSMTLNHSAQKENIISIVEMENIVTTEYSLAFIDHSLSADIQHMISVYHFYYFPFYILADTSVFVYFI